MQVPPGVNHGSKADTASQPDCSRPAPDGVTPADAAYLGALYSAKLGVVGASQKSHVVERMADFLAGARAVGGA
jgi:hypothetical protein